jgi:hypothetical protein
MNLVIRFLNIDFLKKYLDGQQSWSKYFSQAQGIPQSYPLTLGSYTPLCLIASLTIAPRALLSLKHFHFQIQGSADKISGLKKISA